MCVCVYCCAVRLQVLTVNHSYSQAQSESEFLIIVSQEGRQLQAAFSGQSEKLSKTT